MKPKFTKGKANQESLSDRMKSYEDVTTGASLIPRLPVYARIDGRAFHTFCRGLQKPFDMDFCHVMQETCRYLVEKFGAAVGYVQSDEISLGWLSTEKVPFETRLFKLQSVLASAATTAFILAGLKTPMADRIRKMMPTFDCRVCQMPDESELANMFLWREMDCVKNAITLVALSKFSTKQIHQKNGDDKVAMLKTVGVDFYEDISPELRRGTYFRRELYQMELTPEQLARIPESQRPQDGAGPISVTRSHIVSFDIGMPLLEVANKPGVLFNNEAAINKKDLPQDAIT